MKTNIKSIVDGTDSSPPFLGLTGSGYISDYSIWKDVSRHGCETHPSGMPHGRYWEYQSKDDARRALKVLGHGFMLNSISAASLGSALRPAGHVIEINKLTVLIPARPTDIKRLKTLAKYGITDGQLVKQAKRTAMFWAEPNSICIGLPVVSHGLKYKLTLRGWLVDVTATDSHDGLIVAALAAARSTLNPATRTVAEIVHFVSDAVKAGIAVEADFDVENPWEAYQENSNSLIAELGPHLPGWLRQTSKGLLLRDFQKDGVRFALARGTRAVIADQMGTGKTAQAIGVAQVTKAQRVLVVAPAAVREVWVNEIERWDATRNGVQLMSQGGEAVSVGTRWIITSYDLISSRSAAWKEPNLDLFKSLSLWLKGSAGVDIQNDDSSPKKNKIVFSQPVSDAESAPVPVQRKKAWLNLQRRLSNPHLRALLGWQPDLLILDEAHRTKTADAKRTLAAIALSQASKCALGLTGTPLQNRTDEAATLAQVIFPGQYQELKDSKISAERCRDLLKEISIRRLKVDVLTQLPAMTEQSIRLLGDVVTPNPVDLLEDQWEPPTKLEVPEWANGLTTEVAEFARWVSANLKRVESMRAEIGLKKACRVDVIEYVSDAAKGGPIVVFAAHHNASDALSASLTKLGYRTVVADGRTVPSQRSKVVAKFQSGDIDVLIAGLEALSEGVALTRASTVIFLELGWKPTTHQQARDRLHRMGQTQPVSVMYLIAPHALDLCLASMIENKAQLLADVHEEKVVVLGRCVTAPVAEVRPPEIPLEQANPQEDQPPTFDAKRKLAAERQKRYRERLGEASLTRQREYTRRWRKKNVSHASSVSDSEAES